MRACRAPAPGSRQTWPVAPIISTAEIARSAEEVFAYVTDPSTFPEWQQGVVSGHMNESPTRVGSQCTTVRNIGGRERQVHTTITDYEPPRRWADRGIDWPDQGVSTGRCGASRGQLTIARVNQPRLHWPRDRKAPGAVTDPTSGRARDAREHEAT